MNWDEIFGNSADSSNSLSPVARLGAVGQKYTDPLAWIFGKKYTNLLTKIADKSNQIGAKVGKPLTKIDKTLNPVRRLIPAVDKVANWTEQKPADTAAIAAGAYFGGSALNNAFPKQGGGKSPMQLPSNPAAQQDMTPYTDEDAARRAQFRQYIAQQLGAA